MFMELDILNTKAVGGDYNMQELMEQLGEDMRYSSDTLHCKDSPILKKYGVKRLT